MMPATALYILAMSPAAAFDYTRGALDASGVTLGGQSPPSQIDFSLTRKDLETGSIDAVMPGRAMIAAAETGKSTVTIAVDPATQFIVYAVGLGLVALVFGNFFFSMGGLWFLLVIGAEGYLFWSIFSKWPGDALAAIRVKMLASPAVSGGTPAVQLAVAPIFAPQPPLKPRAAGIAEEIRHLAELRDQGHITKEEFDAKKAELLKRI